ncbi:flagellar hook-length control protein FliK [Rheinheimera sp. UJ51]|uniref:flagellar hook-length control protein FliK n=1 Tax=Rheinheimera sp. UJ51 TaxID=2892446 RepID=UPI001E32296A|nr:flagellar hook-length control protein FliK [Rheinheimera sp. UJ51]MCC5450461.1 flagellar hook-length control protein FliK [Rheinheimera sp. UJ51]
MTQGLQFSLMFNGLDSTPSGEQAAAGQFNDPASAQQAGVFQQLLQDKQQKSTAGQNVAANSRQAIKAPVANTANTVSAESTEQTQASTAKPLVTTADHRAFVTEPKMVTDPSLADNTEASAELAAELDIAGQWLGLIKQSTDTSAQLRYRTRDPAEFFQIQPIPDFQTIGPVPAPEDSLFNQFDAQLLSAEIPAGDLALDAFSAAQLAAGKLTAQAHTTEPSSATALTSKVADTDVLNASAGNTSATATTLSEKPLTDAAQEQGQAAALLALKQKTSATQFTLNDSPVTDRLTPIIPITDAAALAEVIDSNLSDVAPEKTADKAAALASLAPSAIKAESKAVLDEQAAKALKAAGGESTANDAALNQVSQAQQGAAKSLVTASTEQAVATPVTAKQQNAQSVQTAPTIQTAELSSVDLELETAGSTLPEQAVAIKSAASNQAQTVAINKMASQSNPANTIANQPVSSLTTAAQQNDSNADILTAEAEQTEQALADLEAQIAVSNSLNSKTRQVETPQASVAAANSAALPSSAQSAATASMQSAPLQSAALNNVTEDQAEPIMVTAPTAELTKVPTASAESAANTKLNTLEHVAKNAANSEQQHEQSGQQRQDARQFAAVNLEVSLAQQANNVPAASSSTPTASELANNMLRAEGFAGALEQQTRANQSKAPAATLPTSMQQLQLQQDAAGQLRERVQIMVRQNIQVADIRLDPAELGQMQIRVNLQQEQASVQFIVQQAHAKELLEQQMPRLRELLQQQGIQLGEGQVQQQSRQDRQSADSGSQQGQGQGSALFDDIDGPVQERSVEVQHSDRIVDYYA